MSEFYTIKNATKGLYKEKGSKFMAFAFPIRSGQEIKSNLADLRKEYHDARHHCYAWVRGLSDQKSRANDDGEPAHSAGMPILGQIKSSNLTNVLVVVVRYFGGTKLGVGGLTNAYKVAAADALQKGRKEVIYEVRNLTLDFEYDQISQVERLIDEYDLEVTRIYGEKCQVKGSIKEDDIIRFRQSARNYYTISIQIES